MRRSVAFNLVITLLASAIASSSSSVAAQEPARPDTSSSDPHAAQPERPSVATHAGTVAPGWFEIESGVERDRVSSALASYLTPTVAKFGLASHVQLSLFGAFSRPAPGLSGIGDSGVGIKWRLADDAPIVGDFALLPSVKLPTGNADKGTGTGTTDVSLLLISSHDISGVSVDINVAYTRRSGDGSAAPTSATLWTVSTGGSLAAGFGWGAEVYGYPGTSGPSGQAPIVGFLAGPTLLVRPWLVVDAGFIARIAGPQPKAFYTGVVWNIGKLWGPAR